MKSNDKTQVLVLIKETDKYAIVANKGLESHPFKLRKDIFYKMRNWVKRSK